MDELTPIIERFAARLRELRHAAGLTQTGLARRAGVPQATLASYEIGRNTPSWAAVVRLANALGVPTDAFRAVSATVHTGGKQDST